MLKFACALVCVKDMALSRRFYEECLGQKVRFDFGEDVEFEGGFTIHQQDHFQKLLGGEQFAMASKAHWGELYFDADDDIAIFEQRLRDFGVELIHAVREEPWGQRVMRAYDPDGHVMEIGETMEAAVLRLFQQGGTVESICQRTGMPRSFVERALRGGEE